MSHQRERRRGGKSCKACVQFTDHHDHHIFGSFSPRAVPAARKTICPPSTSPQAPIPQTKRHENALAKPLHSSLPREISSVIRLDVYAHQVVVFARKNNAARVLASPAETSAGRARQVPGYPRARGEPSQ